MRKSANNRYPCIDESEASSEEQSSEEEHPGDKSKSKKMVVPRFIKNEIDEIDTDIIVVNISRTQYEVVEEVANELGWKVERSRKSQKWDILWIDSHIEAHDLFKLNDHQRISHYPAIYVLTRKNFLGRSLMKMSRQLPGEYRFFPFTWSIPSEYTQLMRYDENLKVESSQAQYYIYKPEAMAQGKGIKLYNNIEQLEGKNGIVQTYINNPLLIENLKFDLRIYVLIMGCDPLRIFIYDEGLGRFATQKYQKAGRKNMKDVHMHLTNYSLNKNSKNFVFNTSHQDMNKGHKRSLSAIYSYLASIDVDVAKIKSQIDDMVIKTLIVGQPMIAHTYGLAQADNQANDLCFQILGFDVMIDSDLNPVLLQVNHTPSFKTDTPLDKFIKKNLIKDTLKLLNISVENKRQKVQHKKEFIEKRQQRKLTKMTLQEKEVFRKKKNQERDQYELNNLGNFRKIFPIQQSAHYQRMIDYSKKIFNEQYGFRNKGGNSDQQMSNTSRPRTLNKRNLNKKERVVILQQIHKKQEKDPKQQEKDGENIRHTVALDTIEQTKSTNLRNSSDRFPSIAFARKEQQRNFSGYMSNSIKRQFSFNQRIDSSASPIQKKGAEKGQLNILEQKLRHQGNFVAVRILQMSQPSSNQILPQKQSTSQYLNQKSINSKSFSPTVIHKNLKTTKNIELVSQEAINKKKASPLKKMTYEYLINNLSESSDGRLKKEQFKMKLNPIN